MTHSIKAAYNNLIEATGNTCRFLQRLVAPAPHYCRSTRAERGENQEFETNAPPGHGSTAALYELRMIFGASSFKEG